MTALVSGLVWACLAGIAVAVVVAGAVAGLIRVQRPSAATRCALWLTALAMCAIAPLAIAGAMVARGTDGRAGATAVAMSAPSEVPATHERVVQNGTAGDDAPTRNTGTEPAALPALDVMTRALDQPPTLSHTIALTIVIIWAAGAVAGLSGLGRGLLRLRALKARSSALEGSLADDLPWLTERPGREIYLRLSYEIETPMAVGFRRPVILIPTDMATAGGLSAIESLVMHEYAHLARYDDWSNLAQRVIERSLWFNPLVWIVGRRIALEREVAADDEVVARTNDASQYASTLWRMAREMRMPEHVVVAPGAMLTRKQISIRIERLLEDSRYRRPQAGIAVAVLAVGAGTVAAVAATAPPIAFPSVASYPPLVAQSLATAAPAPAPSALLVRSAAPSHSAPSPYAAPTPPPQRTPPVPPLPNVDAIAAHAARRALALVPHALPDGELTRAVVAACSTCDFSNRNLAGLDLSRLAFYGARFDGADLSGADLSDTRLIGVSMRHANLTGARFGGARIAGSQFEGTDFNGTDFSRARIAGASLVDGCSGCDFSGADLHGQDLHGARLDGANLTNADLHGANLRGARLTGANFTGADLDHADLRGAGLAGALLGDASMDGTLTAHADLTGATLP